MLELFCKLFNWKNVHLFLIFLSTKIIIKSSLFPRTKVSLLLMESRRLLFKVSIQRLIYKELIKIFKVPFFYRKANNWWSPNKLSLFISKLLRNIFKRRKKNLKSLFFGGKRILKKKNGKIKIRMIIKTLKNSKNSKKKKSLNLIYRVFKFISKKHEKNNSFRNLSLVCSSPKKPFI